jgi:hypothetical protein
MTIKVLITGYTAQHTGSKRLLVKYGAVSEMFADILRQGGCEVDHRRVVPDEDISGYDLLLCGQMSLGALGASYAYGALDAIGRARANGVGLMFYLDDWQVHTISTALRTISKDSNRLVRASLSTCRHDHSWGCENVDRIFPVVEALLNRPWPPTLIPKFTFGDGQMIVKGLQGREWVWTDVSAFAHDYNTTIPQDTDRYAQWVLGTLSDQRAWVDRQKLSWPVEYLGSKKSKADKVVTEEELCQMYANSWGVMAAKYPHAGSGWWRNRFVHAVRTRSIMLADPKEVHELGEPYLIPGREIEKMNVQQLREVADGQRDAFYAAQAHPDEVIDTVMSVVRRVVAEAKS